MDKITVALIYGSTREGRFCDKVASWAASRISAGQEFTLDVIDPKISEAADLKSRIGKADAFIIVTPEYNHSYPAALKHLIDSVNEEWRAKPVSFVSYGGVSGGLRAVEHLRGVFAELHAVTIRDSVSFSNVWSQFGADGKLLEPAVADQCMEVLLRHLSWWAAALRDARRTTPYGQAAAA